MTPWRRLLFSWAGRLPTRIIDAEQSSFDPYRSPLFERSHIKTVRLPLLGRVTFYLHHYLRSDPDRGPHDHPWAWAVAIPLAGGYHEERFTGFGGGEMWAVTRRRRPFIPYLLRGADFHRVIVEDDTTNWSLFFHCTFECKPWGFMRQVAQRTWTYVSHAASNEPTHWWDDAPAGNALKRAEP